MTKTLTLVLPMTSATLHLHQTPFSRHYFSLLQTTTITTMPCSSKTLMDFFPQSSNRNPKRLKTQSNAHTDGSLHSISPIDDTVDRNQNPSTPEEPCSGSSCLSAEQKARMELKKCLAKAKRNLKICSDKVLNSKAAGDKGYVKLDELLVEDSWLEAIPGELEKPYAKNLCKFVQTEICSGSLPIYPPPYLMFNALNSTPFDKVKVVILGQDPYHGPGQAMGLSFSVPEGVKIPPSLMNMFKELKQDLGCSIPSHGNLERWTVQGVLLLNTVLTVRHHQANSHAKKGWEQFTDAVIRTISEKKRGVVFLLWGNCAQEKSRLIDGSKHHILKSAHPSGLSANRGFFGCRHFSRTNQILEQIGELPIEWQL